MNHILKNTKIKIPKLKNPKLLLHDNFFIIR